MQLRQTQKVMKWLRDRASTIRPNNMKIDPWVETYINDCILNGDTVILFTQCCLAKGLEARYKKQGNQLIPTKKELKCYLEEIPDILNAFNINNIKVNWYIVLNRSFLDSGRIDVNIEKEYQKMIDGLIEMSKTKDVMVLSWEEDLFDGRPGPDKDVQENLFEYVKPEAFQIELDRYRSYTDWVTEKTGIKKTEGEIVSEIALQIACETEEGRFLVSRDSPFQNGKFILIPFELPERYEFFKIKSPDFKKMIVPVLKPYPWRINQ